MSLREVDMMEAILDGPFGRLTVSTPVFTIGRAPANQLVLEDKKASGHHAEIRFLGQEGYSITDLGSTNGTFVNEQRLKQRVLRILTNGEMIRIGDTRFLYVLPEVQAVTPTVYSPSDQQGIAPTVYAAQPGQGVPPTTYPQSNAAQYNHVLQSTAAAPPPPLTPYTPLSSLPPVPVPPVSAPTQPQKRNLLWLWITLAGIGVLLVIIMIGAIANASASNPAKTLDAFCTDMQNEDYHAAYTEFSPSYQQRTPERYFVGLLTLANIHFASCTYSPVNENGDTATSTLTYQSTNGKTGTDQVTLIKDSNSDWKINYFQGLSQG